MPRARDFLARFRPVGTPGPAASAGVPADRIVEATVELEPLFAMLADTEVKAEGIRASADQLIAENHRLAAERTTEVLAQARLRAERAGRDDGDGPEAVR